MDERHLVYAPRAQRDILSLEVRYANQILRDLEILKTPPWPPRKVKPLRGTNFWEIKTGDFRSLFWPVGKRIVVLRVVYRRDLVKALGRIDIAALIRWLREVERSNNPGQGPPASP